MIKKRPTLPTGYSLAGLPPISNVLHSDERFERYVLGPPYDAAKNVNLVLVRNVGRSQECESRLTNWWSVQQPEILTLLKVIDGSNSPQDYIAAVLQFGGQCADDIN